MGATLDTRKAHAVRQHGDLTAIYSWINDERALILVPSHRPGAPWYCVLESASYTWDDEDPQNVPMVAMKAAKACDVLGIEPTSRNARRVAEIIIDGLPELIRMPTKQPNELEKAAIGAMQLRADGKTIAEQDIRLEKEDGVTYG